MNPLALRQREFWSMAGAAATAPHGSAPKVLADWLDEHDSPVRADLLRRGVPIHQVASRGAEYRQTSLPNYPGVGGLDPFAGWTHLPAHTHAHGVIFPDEGLATVRVLRGGGLEGREPHARTRAHPETFELYTADALHQPNARRWVVVYTLATRRGHLRLVAPVGPEHLRALADVLPRDPSGMGDNWNWYAEHLRRTGHEDHPLPPLNPEARLPPVRLARVSLGPPIPALHMATNENAIIHHVHDEAGNRIGSVKLVKRYGYETPEGVQNRLHITWTGRPPGAPGPNSLGSGFARAVHDSLAAAYPDATHISGDRVTGAHKDLPPAQQEVVYPIRRRPVQLARWTDTRTQLHTEAHAALATGDYHPMKVLADKMEEDGEPGAHVLRAGAEHLENGGVRDPGHVTQQLRTDFHGITPDLHAAVSRGQDGQVWMHMAHMPENSAAFTVGAMPSIEYSVPVHSLEHFGQLSADWSPEARTKVARSLYNRGVPVRLARMVHQATPGGTIVNNQFQKGGQFIARVRKRIRDVAAKLVKLARPPSEYPEFPSLAHSVHEAAQSFTNRENPQPTDRPNNTPRLVLADWLEEHGIPGANIVRMRGEVNLTQSERAAENNAAGVRIHNTPMVTLEDEPQVRAIGRNKFNESGRASVIRNLHVEGNHHPVAHLSWRAAGGGLNVALNYHRGDGTAFNHNVRVYTADDLRRALADFPHAARVRLLQPLIDTGVLRRVLRGRGKGAFQLARPPLAPVDLSAPGVLGKPVSDTPLSLGELKRLEDSYALGPKQRLSPRVEQPKSATGDEHPYTVKVNHIIRFLDTLSKAKIPSDRHRKILADPKVSDGEKLVHLVSQLRADYEDSTHPPEGGSWYGGQVSHLDRAIHRIAAKGKPHPLWGTLGSDGELLGKAAPHENHPGLVLFKAVIAATSGSQNPVDNLKSALKAMAAGKRAGHPIINLPDFNHEALSEWIDKAKRLHGVTIRDTEKDADLRNPGTDIAAQARWYARWIAPHREELEKAGTGFAARDARIVPSTGHVVWVEQNKKHIKVGREHPDAIQVKVPYTKTGVLNPKGWGTYGTQTAERLAPIKALYKHFAELNPNGSDLEHMRNTARWLIEEHTPQEFDDMAEALRRFKADLPYLKPHLYGSKAVFGKGFTDEENPSLPGMFVLGPKFGSFAMNLHSNDPTTRVKWRRFLTADMWWTRNFMRYLGRLQTKGRVKASPGVNDRRQMLRAVNAVCSKLGVTPADLQADLWYHEQALYRMLGADAKHVESLSYADAADRLLDPNSPKALRDRDGKMVQLSREDEQAAFHKAMADDPNDATTRLVYADWLDEHDQPVAAARLRWWARVLPHMPKAGKTDALASQIATPEWATRLVLQHYARSSGYPDEIHSPDELHALGLAPDLVAASDHNPHAPPSSATGWINSFRDRIHSGSYWNRAGHAVAAQQIAERLGLETPK